MHTIPIGEREEGVEARARRGGGGGGGGGGGVRERRELRGAVV